jgi:hypothetical protein
LVGLYIKDPVMHAWYKGEAIDTYLYLHNFGTGHVADDLIAAQMFTADEIHALNHRQGAFQTYFASPEAANSHARAIIKYMADVHLLHDGKYQQLDPIGRMRYLFFIRTGITPPTDWSFLDPSVGD